MVLMKLGVLCTWPRRPCYVSKYYQLAEDGEPDLILVSVLCLAQLWNRFSLPNNGPSPFGMASSHKLGSLKPNQFFTRDVPHPPSLPNSYFCAFVYNKFSVWPFISPGFRVPDMFSFLPWNSAGWNLELVTEGQTKGEVLCQAHFVCH